MTPDQVLTALMGAGGLALVTLWAVWLGFRQARGATTDLRRPVRRDTNTEHAPEAS